MAAQQPLDPDFQRLSNESRSGLSFRRIDVGDKELIVDMSNGFPRPFVPQSMRHSVFQAIHSLGHPGTHRTAQIVASKFVWPSVKSDCSKWAKECIPCQRSKVTRNTTPAIGEFEVPTRRFSHLHIDIVSLTPSNGFSHLLTIVDRFTRWPAAIPIANMAADTVIDAFSYGWVSQFGVPSAITSDRGSQFTGVLWEQLLKHWGIKPLRTTAYHPESNGLVERLHRRLKEALLAICDDSPQDWYWRLPSALLSIRTTLKPDIGSSPADLVFGEGLAVPGDLHGDFPSDPPQLLRQRQSAQANLRLEVARLQPKPTSAHRRPTVFIPPDLADATHVFVRRGGVQPCFATPYEGPYRIMDRTAAGYQILMPGGRLETVALSRLKPAHVDMDDAVDDPEQRLDDEAPPSPRPPGRPPGVRTRIPEPTDRSTRGRPVPQQTTNRVQPRRSDSSGSARPAAAPPSESAAQSRKPTRRKTPHIAEYNLLNTRPARHLVAPNPAVLDPPQPPLNLPSQSSANQLNSQPPSNGDQPLGAGFGAAEQETNPDLASPTTVARLKRLRSEAFRSEQLYNDEDEPSNQPSFFEIGDLRQPTPHLPAAGPQPAVPSASVPSSSASLGLARPDKPRRDESPSASLGLARPDLPRRDETANNEGSSSTLGPVRFSAKRDGFQGRRFFSDIRPRRKPDVSVILNHLGMSSSSEVSSSRFTADSSTGGRVDLESTIHPPPHPSSSSESSRGSSHPYSTSRTHTTSFYVP